MNYTYKEQMYFHLVKMCLKTKEIGPKVLNSVTR